MQAINPEVLVWARETAGLPVAEAARKLGFKDGKSRSAVDRLERLEAGTDQPSRTTLLAMAKHYHRPLLSFYLASPPVRGDRGQDFRTLPEALDPIENALVDALIRDVRARQEMVRSELEDEEVPPITWIGSKSIGDGVTVVASEIARAIAFEPLDFYGRPNPEAAFTALREKVEALGIFVLLIGNLGSHHTALEPDVFRGFVIADSLAPFVVVNDQDSKAAWSFTLLHEVAHLWLGATGVSGGKPSASIERFCNDVASEILLSGATLNSTDWSGISNLSQLTAAIESFARPKNLSYSLVAYRLFKANFIKRELWEVSRRHFRDMWRRQRASARQLARENNERGPTYYIVRRHRLGKALVGFVRQQIEEGDLTQTKAAKILGVRPRSVASLIEGVRTMGAMR